MNNAFFSVIIPCYNSRKWLDISLNSLENQTFKDFEVIVVDDCSSDDTYDYITDYQRNTNLSLNVLKNARNSGPGVSRNNALKEAHGEYVTFLDSDDWYENDFLKKMFSRIQETGADIVFCDFYRDFVGDKSQVIRCTAHYSEKTTKKEYVALCYDSLCVAGINRKLFDGISLPVLYNAEDSAMVPLLVSKASKITYIPEALYHYLCRKSSLSTSKSKKIADSFYQAYQFLRKEVSLDYKDEIVFRGIRMILYGVVYNSIRLGENRNSFGWMVKEFQEDNPGYFQNPYMKTLPKRKVFFIWCVKKKWDWVLRYYCKLQEFFLHIN